MQVLDRLAVWQRLYKERKKHKENYHLMRFLYKAIFFTRLNQENRPMLEMMFSQACNDMRIHHYPCTEVDMITLLSLLLRTRRTDDDIEDHDFEFFSGFPYDLLVI